MHVCYVALATAPWLVIAGAVAALYGLLVSGEAGRVLGGAVTVAAGAGAGSLAFGLIRALVAEEERRPARADARPRQPR